MVRELSCPQCGAVHGERDTFCANCGQRITVPPLTGAANTSQSGDDWVADDDLLLQKIREHTVGEYEIRGLLGRGGMASVFIAYDLTLNRKVAIKAMHPGFLGDTGMRERFRLEARLAARLDHPNIVTVHAVKERGRIVFFDLKLIDGVPLDQLIRYRTQPLPVDLACWTMSKIADALHYAHGQGVVHRDMKPANVMVERRGECIVTDFGIAKATGEASKLTLTGAVVGTPAYMSPEQCLGGDVTAASDQYSLGIMAYELLTGTVPFTGTLLAMQLGHVEKTPSSPRELSDAVPQDVSDVVMRMIEKEPTSRWPSLAAASSALAHHAGANDSAMRRRMSELVAEVPDTVRKSFPATPRTPMPTAAPLPAPRPREATTAPVPTLIDGPGGAVTPVVESKDAAITVATRPWVTRQRRGVMIGAAAVLVTIIGAVVTLSGGRGTQTAVVPAAASDSVTPSVTDSSAIATRRAAAVAREDSLLDVVDTTVARILIRPGTVALAVGDSVHLAAAIYSGSGDELKRRVRWTSSDTTIVRVNADGWIFGLAKPRGQNEVIFVTASASKKEGLTTVRLK